MTRNEAKELLPLIQAHADGKTIQYKDSSGIWRDVQTPSFFSHYIYRIKQEPREFWLTFNQYGPTGIHFSEENANSLYPQRRTEIIHVREVIDGESK